MTLALWIIALVLLAYLTGAIPTSVWTGRLLFGEDVRKKGSGNAGATNTFRAFGAKIAIFVLVIDIAKGILAVNYPNFLVALNIGPYFYPSYIYLLLGLAAAAGHIYPVYVGFKGGKGVATLFGVIIGIDWKIALICLATFIVVFLVRRIVSIASITAGIVFAIAYLIIHQPYDFMENILAGIYPLVLIITHRENISRLLKGKEPAFTLRRNKSPETFSK